MEGVPWLLALAVSIDGFSAGFSCGLRRLEIPFASLVVICLSSAGAITISMLAGSGVALLIPVQYLRFFGGAVLAVLGCFVLAQHLDGVRKNSAPASAGTPRRWGKLAALLRQPQTADLDQSGSLSMKEALLLGAALAADAFGAGFGAALIGSPVPATVLAVGVTKLVLVPLGVFLGRLAAGGKALKNAPLLGGVILIVIGIMTII